MKKKIKFNKRIFISSTLIITSFLLIFPAGKYSDNANLECAGEYITEIVKEHTQHEEYASFIVEPNNENNKLNATDTELFNLYGAFRESKACFAGTVNADKKHFVHLKEADIVDNLSFLYVENAGFSNVEYKDAYKHESYPLQLMFRGKHYVEPGDYSFFYISQTQAGKILMKRGLEITKQNYESLLGTSTLIDIDGKEYRWTIANIYLETNYFYDALTDVMGSFLLGYNKYPEQLSKQALFFMRDYTYQNMFYLEYISKVYPKESYNYTIGTFNLSDYQVDYDLIMVGFTHNNYLLFYILLIICCISFIVGLLIYLLSISNNVLYYVFFFCLCFLPYLFYKFLYLLSWNIYLFSHISCVYNLIMLMVLIVIISIRFTVCLTKKKAYINA